ncbi:MAG: hypothetical protein WAK31_03350 [Chthoniobacterales bacterium]
MTPDTDSNQSAGAKPAVGFGPNHAGAFSQEDYYHPAAGWGSAISVSKVLLEQGELIDGTRAVFEMDHENSGYDGGQSECHLVAVYTLAVLTVRVASRRAK